jgi:uncharacterized protein (AIM24 family)
MNTKSIIAIGVLTTASLVASAGSTVNWNAAVSGDWNLATNWNPMLVPSLDDDVFLGLGGMYTVTVNHAHAARTLSITNPDAGITINNGQTLSVFGALSNDGTVLVNPVSGNAITTLFFGADASLNGSGSVVLNGFGPRARIETAPGMTLFHGDPHTIMGQGQIEALMVNDGLVRANVIGSKLVLMNNPITNNAVFEAVDGGKLDIAGVTVTQGEFGVIGVDGPNSEVLLTGSTVVDGRLVGVNDGGIAVTSESTLDGVSTDCSIDVRNGNRLNIRNSITNDAFITVNPVAGDSETSLMFLDNSSLEGTGSVVLNGFGARARIQTDEGMLMTNALSHTIQGQGQIDAAMLNEGLVSADVVATELVLMTNDKTNNGTMQAINGAILGISGITVTQTSGPAIERVTGGIFAEGLDSMILLAGSTIVDGSVESFEDASIVVSCSTTFDNVSFFGDLNILSSHRLILKEGTTSNGTIMVNPVAGEAITTLEWGDEMILEGEGKIVLAASGPRSVLGAGLEVEFGGIGPDQRLEGAGQIELPFINHGTIAPGLSLGVMAATQPVMFTETSVFEAEVSTASADLFNSVSMIELGGTLDVLFIDGFAPTGFWARTIMQGSLITDEFDTLNIPPAPAGLVTRVINTGTEYIVGQSCLTDYNLDGQLNFFDVSIFLNAFNSNDPLADVNNDGIFNFFDVSAFMNTFTDGCVF